MFLLKKIASALLSPLPLSIIAVLLGLIMLICTKRARSGKVLILFGITTLTMFSLPPISNALLASLESQYPAYLSHPAESSHAIKHIVVLGGGHTSDPTVPVTSQINTTTLARLAEGIRLHKMTAGSRLILSGGHLFDDKSEAETMQTVALLMGIEESAITLDKASLDTKDQALNIKTLIADDNFILVTSASHMPRSMALFRKQGMSPIAAPANHAVLQADRLSPGDFFPNAQALRNSEKVIHEYLGIAWAKLRGQI